MVKYGYKVVLDTDGKLVSCASVWVAGLRYHVGKWTVRVVGNGPLAVYDDLGDALGFTRRVGATRVYKAAYIPSRSKCGKLWYTDDNGKIWSYPHDVMSLKWKLPEGTVFADAVCLLEKIG